MDEPVRQAGLPAVTVEAQAARAERHYARLRRRASRWLAEHRLGGLRGEMVLLLPDLFMLLIRLLRDGRIAAGLKVQLLAASAYVIAPFDLVPDFLVPAGLSDDVVAVAYVLGRVVAIMGQAGEDVLREHWAGSGDILEQVRRVAAVADRVVNGWALRWLRRRFAGRQGKRR